MMTLLDQMQVHDTLLILEHTASCVAVVIADSIPSRPRSTKADKGKVRVYIRYSQLMMIWFTGQA